MVADLEKAVQAALADILSQNPAFTTEDGGRGVEDGKLRMDERKLMLDDGK